MVKKGNIPWNKGKKLSEDHKRKLSESHKGQRAWNKGLTKDDDSRIKGKPKKARIMKFCKNCNKIFNVIITRRNAKFCSLKCSRSYSPDQSIRDRISKTLKEKYSNGELIAVKSDDTKKKISDTLKGHEVSDETRKRISNTVKELWEDPLYYYLHIGENNPMFGMKGEKNPNWKGGISYNYGDNWNSIRKQILKRDKYICQYCRAKNEMLDVHHIIPYRISEDNSNDNLVSLCKSCHVKVEWETNRRLPDESEVLGIFYEKYEGDGLLWE